MYSTSRVRWLDKLPCILLKPQGMEEEEYVLPTQRERNNDMELIR